MLNVFYYYIYSMLHLGADMDLCLSNYGFCNYVSGKHATIFYDKVSLGFFYFRLRKY